MVALCSLKSIIIIEQNEISYFKKERSECHDKVYKQCKQVLIRNSGLGKSVEFFLADAIVIPQIGNMAINKIAFYAGEPSQKQKQIAKQLMELMENIDEVISAKSRFENVARG